MSHRRCSCQVKNRGGANASVAPLARSPAREPASASGRFKGWDDRGTGILVVLEVTMLVYMLCRHVFHPFQCESPQYDCDSDSVPLGR